MQVKNNTQNSLLNLHNLLMEAAERIMDADTPEEIDREIKVSKALADVGKVTVANAAVILDAQKTALEYGLADVNPNKIFALECKKD